MIKKSEDISKSQKDEQYETGNEGERDRNANDIGGRDGAKLDRAMKRKYKHKDYRYKEYR